MSHESVTAKRKSPVRDEVPSDYDGSVLVYTKARNPPYRAATMRRSPVAPVRVIRVMDLPAIRSQLLADPRVIYVWGPFSLLELQGDLADLLVPTNMLKPQL